MTATKSASAEPFTLTDVGSHSTSSKYELQVAQLEDGRTEVQVAVTADRLMSSELLLSYPVSRFAPVEGEYGDWPQASGGAVGQSADMSTPGRVKYSAQVPPGNAVSGRFRILSVVFETVAPVAAAPHVSAERWMPEELVPAGTSTAYAPARLPLDPAWQTWVSQYYLSLPPLSSSYGVYASAPAKAYADEIAALTNAERARKGLPQLGRDPHLDAVAQAHALHMAQAGFFEHQSPLGMEVFERLDAAGAPKWWSAGENISMGYPDAQSCFKGWMDSKGHKKNIRFEPYRHIGVGAYYSDASRQWYWVQVFASFDTDPAAASWLEPGSQP